MKQKFILFSPWLLKSPGSLGKGPDAPQRLAWAGSRPKSAVHCAQRLQDCLGMGYRD